MINRPWWSGDYSLFEFKGQYLNNHDCLHLRFTKQLLSLKSHRKSEHFTKFLLKMPRFGLGFTGDPLKLHYRYYPLLWFEDSPCCPFRSQPITASVVKTNGVCRSHQSDLPVYCVIWSPHEIDSSPGTEWMSYFAHKHTRMSGESLPPLRELFIAVFSFLHSQLNLSSGAERLTCLLNDTSLFKSHAKFSPQHLFKALKH